MSMEIPWCERARAKVKGVWCHRHKTLGNIIFFVCTEHLCTSVFRSVPFRCVFGSCNQCKYAHHDWYGMVNQEYWSNRIDQNWRQNKNNRFIALIEFSIMRIMKYDFFYVRLVIVCSLCVCLSFVKHEFAKLFTWNRNSTFFVHIFLMHIYKKKTHYTWENFWTWYLLLLL